MKGLHEWMEAQLAEHKTEPNSGLGRAISYLLNRWSKLTLFQRQAGAPIDNNIVERALKKAILNRKNALFYKTLNGAGVGDLLLNRRRAIRSVLLTVQLGNRALRHVCVAVLRPCERGLLPI
jgi:hypothetical protein